MSYQLTIVGNAQLQQQELQCYLPLTVSSLLSAQYSSVIQVNHIQNSSFFISSMSPSHIQYSVTVLLYP